MQSLEKLPEATEHYSMTTNQPEIESLIQHEFELAADLIYLNHAAVSPWPRRTRDAVTKFANENFHQGSLDYPGWLKVEHGLREKIQTLINAPSSNDIAIVKNTSEALSLVAGGINWQQGDNIVITDQEFPFNHIVWQSLESRGVELRVAMINSFAEDHPEQALFKLCDESTRLIAISSIQYGTGLKMNSQQVGEFCHANGILFLLDAIQSIGAVNFDVQECNAHFVMADGHKWMMGPEGAGFFYCDSEQRDQLKLTQYGWHMLEAMGNYKTRSWKPAKSARRFECGSPNMLGIHALDASLSLTLEVGMDAIETRNQQHTELMLKLIEAHDQLELLSPSDIDRLGGIVTFKHKKHAPEKVYRELMDKRIMCAERGGGVRFSPHFYTDRALIENAIDVANKL